IGTHRLLSSDVVFKDLGLLIIDEEQRFGVKHKEYFKKIRPALDVLSLSATPIPRTMYLAMSRLRNMSKITTPPPGRLPIKTFVLPYSKTIIKEAINAELSRKGQVYFLHNRIETIEERRRQLKELIPEARFEIIHGRLHENDLVSTMEAFRRGKIDVLVATTIIENGLDLSGVNTLIVADSSKLGLGEAYQIRGRIGRGQRQAYAYFLYRPRSLSELAKLRLQALGQASYLGAGLKIALKDLELRGAGNILGREQSGAINAVGLNLYLHLLSQAIEMEESKKSLFKYLR
ncbi:MAG: helicase-related protein, partial [Candidatus Paceibacteria bacterium]